MKKFAVLVAVLGLVLIVFKTAYPSVTIRYRLTIAAELDGQSRTGSGVIEVTYRKNVQILGATAQMTIEVQGDAGYVDLGRNDALVALLKEGPQSAWSGPDYVVPVLFGVTTAGFGPEAFSRIAAVTGRREVPLELLPLMVRLMNTNDPKSAVLFTPPGGLAPNQNLVLQGATIEIVPSGIWPLNQAGVTGVPITRGIQARLPWLERFTGYSGGQFDPDWTHPEKNLVGRDFSIGDSV